MSRGGSYGGGRSSLGYLFEPEEITPYHPAKSNQETEKTPADNNSSVKDDKMIADEADREPHPAPPTKQDSNPIVSQRPACNVYHTRQPSHNSGLLITDRPSTRVRCAPGGPSSLGFLFGDEHEK
ncbi:protein SPIRAL1-like 4 [Phragmites australis]|uniref:protein SPIRAL1-like 4 n=1 Tax=Phragmites australis TaxID=29695 RepID=UPI002D77C5BE|nr:protein SPIRAL1-like 4 [Phragmites australis]